MAKDPDHLAGSFETENTGGLLSGFLAEEDEFDRRALWRIGSWGVAAVGAVVIAVLANQSSIGWRRDQMAAIDLTRQAQQIQIAARDSQNETRRLASAVDTLNGDRDRLYARITSLEQGLDSVTGAIARQGSASGASPTAAEPQPTAPPVAPVATIQTAPANADRAPAADKPANREASPGPAAPIAKDGARNDVKVEAAKPEVAKSDLAKNDLPKADASKADAAKTEPAKADVAKADAVKPDSAKALPATPSMPLMASKSIMAPPDPAAGKLIEPNQPPGVVTSAPISEVVASVPPVADADDEAMAPKAALQRTEFGVDLGSANSVPGLRALWRGLLKSRSNAPLAVLRPIIVVKEAANGPGMQLRLVAGPLNDAGAAAKICAVLAENKRPCDTTIFDGQRLSLKADDTPPADVKPAPQQRRRGMARRPAAAVAPPAVEEAPKKPETSTITSWIGKKLQ